MKPKSKKRAACAALAVVLVLLAAFLLLRPSKPVRIGVLLDLTGPDAVDSDEVLDWAADHINSQGGIAGREVELVYKDTHTGDITQLAQELLDDKSIQAVIGPGTSAEVYEIAHLFVERKKLLISPMATSGDIFRAFQGQNSFWRTVQGDQAQIRTMLHMLAERGVKTIALLSEDTPYGKTFHDWTGFFATEMGLELLHINTFEPGAEDFSELVRNAVEDSPEYLICVAFPEDAGKIKYELDALQSGTRLFLTDAAETYYLIEQFGEGSEGLELVTPAADPDSGFEEAYKADFGYYPWDYAAFTYDAFLLAVYASARQEYVRKGLILHGIESMGDSLQNILLGQKGEQVGWDESGRAVQLLLEGKLPDIEGTTGPLEFDSDYGIDPLVTHYSLNRIETQDGFRDFYTQKRMSSEESKQYGRIGEGASAYRTQASLEHSRLDREITSHELPEKEGLWAVIIATSRDWRNYRHQADALAFYDLLKSNGLDDDHIIILLIDDIPWLEENPLTGDVHHKPDGKNLRTDAEVDYSGNKVSIQTLRNILLANRTEQNPIVLESNEKSNIILYIVDHGMPGAVPFEHGGLLTSEEFAGLVQEMEAHKKFRQMFIMVEVCFGESVGLEIETPNVVYFTGASRTEPSFGATYDHRIRQWLADDFTNHVLAELAGNPDVSIEELYLKVYQSVVGSHVRLVNYENFGRLDTPMSEFVSP